MSSEIRLKKIYPKEYRSAYIEMADGEVIIFPKLKVDRIESNTNNIVEIEGWDMTDVCTLSTVQNITGLKTFMQIPFLPGIPPTEPNHAVRKHYVDNLIRTEIDAIPLTPAGSIFVYAGQDVNNPPEGYFFCNGTACNKTIHTALFTAIGYQYSGGISSGNIFYTPNLQGRVVLGYYSGYAYSQYMGCPWGTDVVELGIEHMPAHDHSDSTFQMGAFGGGGTVWNSPYSATTTTGLAGGGQPHSNMQPSMALNYIIYHGVFT